MLVNRFYTKLGYLKGVVVVSEFIRNTKGILGCFQVKYYIPEIRIGIQSVSHFYIGRCIPSKKITQDNFSLYTGVNTFIVQ